MKVQNKCFSGSRIWNVKSVTSQDNLLRPQKDYTRKITVDTESLKSFCFKHFKRNMHLV